MVKPMKKLKFHRTLFHVNLRADVSCFLCCAQQACSISEKSENIERFRVNECLHSQIFQAVENSIVTVDSGIVRVNVNHVAKRKGTRANSNQNQFPLDFLYTKT